MKKNISIKLKAAFLLIVFTMNTIIGFACAMGFNMGFNSSHHHDEEATEISHHEHNNSKIHDHHNEVAKHSNNKKDDCCNDKVIQIQALDKMMAQNAKYIFGCHGFATIKSMYNSIAIFKPLSAVPQKYIIPSFHPPPPDIRVFIQSFQI
ncbi:MAG: hypothetical protein ABI402_19335 [Ferruginibacter sp.]